MCFYLSAGDPAVAGLQRADDECHGLRVHAVPSGVHVPSHTPPAYLHGLCWTGKPPPAASDIPLCNRKWCSKVVCFVSCTQECLQAFRKTPIYAVRSFADVAFFICPLFVCWTLTILVHDVNHTFEQGCCHNIVYDVSNLKHVYVWFIFFFWHTPGTCACRY